MNQVGRYRIVEELGRGAMGVVYKALDPAIGRTVAIKTIHLSDLTDPEERQRVRERLLREAQSAGVLSHPNIVTIYDVLEKEDYAYIFMEYVNGSSLEKMLRARSLPASAELLHFWRQVAGALDYAHRKGIVHRDIKPANIIISENAAGAERPAKIADFGVAKFVSHEMTHAGAMIGTPNYMSPEQIQGTAIDGRSDQFSLAVVVYELLCGEKPFTAESLPALFYLICKDDPKPVHEVNGALSETVGKVLERALAKDPNQRFASCGDFIGALSIALGDCPNWIPVPRVAAVLEPVALDATAAGAAKVEGEQPVAQSVSESGATLRRSATASPVIAHGTGPNDGSGGGSSNGQPFSASTITRRRRDEEESEEPAERSSFARRLGLILAMCFAIAAAIVFIVKWNSGPVVPVQVLDTGSGPVSPPPTPAGENPRPSAQVPSAPPASTKANAPARAETDQPTVRAEQRPAQSSGAAAPAQTPPPTAAPSAASDVELLSEPAGAKLVVDNNPATACTTPCTLSLSTGRHTLTAELDGYTIARRIFSVPDDDSLLIPMRKSMGVLLVTSTPSGCSVLVDGQPAGQTPTTLHLTPGAHHITVTSGSHQHQEAVEVQTDGFEARRFPCE